MCGIAGSYGFVPNNNQISHCLENLKSRGPDDSGVFYNNEILLIHTRLSVIDITKNAQQPMIDKKTGVVLVFNGEIYNFKELQKNNKFNPNNNSDTRVILEMYLKYGLDAFQFLNGMFAIVIWDPRNQSLYLIRDRFGIKPLYYYEFDNKFIFGSDLNALFDLGAKKEPNLLSIKNYLGQGVTESHNSTFFSNIHSVPSGSIMKINSNNIAINKYWELKYSINNKRNQINKKELPEYIDTRLKQTIESHLVSDVPIGLTLSSGLDSIILLKYLIENNDIGKLNTFTYGYDEKKYDESLKLEKIYKRNEFIPHITKLKKNELLNELSEAINYFQSPIGGLGTLSLFNLMKSIKKQKIKVIFSGEGADEIFAGYKYYFYAFLIDLKNSNNSNQLKEELRNWKILTGEDLSEIINNNKKMSEKIFGMKAPDGTNLNSWELEGEEIKNINTINNLAKISSNSENLNNIRYEDIFIKKLPKLLMFQDRCSMYSSVESRVPFLDHELVEDIFSLDSSNLINGGILKYLLRQNIESSKFNENINTQKEFVATPQREWIKRDLFNEIFEIIMNSNLQELGLVNLKKFKSKYIEYKNSQELGNSFFVWKILNLKYMFD